MAHIYFCTLYHSNTFVTGKKLYGTCGSFEQQIIFYLVTRLWLIVMEPTLSIPRKSSKNSIVFQTLTLPNKFREKVANLRGMSQLKISY